MDEIFLSRKQASEYLRNRGLPVAVATLAKYVTVGGGPQYRKFGRMVRYTKDDLITWVARRLSGPTDHSSMASSLETSIGVVGEPTAARQSLMGHCGIAIKSPTQSEKQKRDRRLMHHPVE